MVKEIEFEEGKWQFDEAMENADWDQETFDWMIGETVKKLDAAEKNEFWKQYNNWKRSCEEKDLRSDLEEMKKSLGDL